MKMDFNTKSLMFVTLLFVAVIFMCCIQSGSAIFCYECNSVNDTRCMDPFDKITASDLYVNCSIEYPQATFCRKIDQTVSAMENNKHRIFRRCAWEEHKTRDCYYGTNKDYKAEICICRVDGCNGALQSNGIVSPIVVATAILFLAVRHLVVT